jgi:hypothetical protein
MFRYGGDLKEDADVACFDALARARAGRASRTTL